MTSGNDSHTNNNDNNNNDGTTTYTPSPPTKSLDSRGFDSSKFLILKGGNSHVRLIS